MEALKVGVAKREVLSAWAAANAETAIKGRETAAEVEPDAMKQRLQKSAAAGGDVDWILLSRDKSTAISGYISSPL